MKKEFLAAKFIEANLAKRIYDQAKIFAPKYGTVFPKKCCALVLSLYLRELGMLPKIEVGTGDLIKLLLQNGWDKKEKMEPNGNPYLPQPGDIFVSVDLDKNGLPDHIGMVVMPFDNDTFICRDNKTNRNGGLYLRNIFAGDFARVDYYLTL